MKKQVLIIVSLLLFGTGFSQTQFWSDNFEDVGAPSSGTRSPSVENSSGGPPATRYFWRCGTANISAVNIYTGMEGSKFWAGEDHRLSPISQSGHQSISWNSINISGKTGLSFKGLFASGPGNFDIPPSTLVTDYLIVEYRIDGGAWQSGLRFFPYNPTIATFLSLETTGDSIGEGVTLLNSANFSEFNFNIAGTGSILDLRLKAHVNGTSEEWAVDNFRLFEAPACSNPVITVAPSNSTVCNLGNVSFGIAATGATSYQWQVNTGSGFTNISNGGVYSNATTTTLNITGATLSMNGYLYRCIASSGACSTTSAQASLTVSNPTLSILSQTNVSCNGGSNGAASVNPASGGVAPYSYNWTPGNPTGDGTVSVTGLTAGTWTCTVTDANSCTASVNFTVTQPTALSLTAASQTNIACNSGSNGAASVNPASGGAGGYSYNWTPGNPAGDGTVSVTGLTAGTWTCTVTDANSCTTQRNFTITQPTALSITQNSQTNVACNSGTTGAASVNTASGGAGGYTYNWTPGNPTGDGTVSVTGLTAGTWTCTVTDANSCTASVNFTVTQPSAISVTPLSQTNVSCNGGSNGAAAINTPTGGAGGYVYNWTPGNPTGDGTVSVSGLTATTWTCTVTDANGCTRTQNFTVTQPTALSVSAASQTNIACNGGSNGAASINIPTGGAGGYTYNWTPGNPSGDGTVSVTGLTAGTWTCTVTDANACTASQNFTVTQPTTLAVTAASQTNVSCNGGSNGAASINTPTGGAGGYTYNWTPGNPTGDGTISVTGLTAGTWTCTVTDANNCTTSQNFTVTQPTDISVTAASQTNISCFGGSNGAASINTPTGGAGGYAYNWTPGNPTGDGTVSVTGLTAGTWTCSVTDANGCTASQNFTVTQPTAISVTAASQTNVSCNGGSNGAASINTPTGGAGGYTYNWTPGNPTGDGTVAVTGLTAQSYTCTVTDANGCTASQNFTVTQPATLAVTAASQTNVSCNGGSNGAASINTPTGGAGGYTYNWTPGNPTGDGTVSVTGLTAGTWTCTVTDANSCTTSQNFTVTQPTAISVTAASQTNVSCNGGSNGAAAINTPTGGAGGYAYNWTPGNPTGDGTVSVTGLTAGTWTCNVTDANGCVSSQNFTVTQPTAISVSAASQTNISCNGGSNGAASINTPTGGAGGYTFNWTPGNPTGDGTVAVTGLTAQSYTCTVTDANGCTASQNFTVTQPTTLSVIAASQTNVSCNGGANGAVSINTPTGGAGGYTYDWSPGNPTGDGTVSITGLTAQTYTCTVTDANGCSASQNFTVTQPTALSVTPASQTNIACNGGSNGAASVNTPTGGAGGYTFDWTPGNPTGDGTISVTGLTAGTWTCSVTDANGCTSSQNFTVTQPTAISLTAASQTNIACNGGSNGAASVNTPTGGAGGYTYDWAPGNPTGDGTGSVTSLNAGTWTCTVTDANGCSASQVFTLTEPIAITNTVSATSCDTYTLNGTTYNTSGTYTQTLTSSLGCDSTLTLNLTINNSSSSTLNITSCSTYTLNGNTYNSSGVYTQTITNAVGCDSTITLNLIINQPSALIITTSACTNYTLNGTTYTSSGTYTQTLTNAVGCDSTITINLTIHQPTSSSITTSACDSYTLNSQVYTSSGTYVQTINNSNGCDSTITLNLTINQSTSSTLNETACGSYTLNSQTFTSSGTYQQTLTNAAGCDSTITLNLTIHASEADTTTITACDSYVWNGQTYTASGFYSLTFTNQFGCDSIENLELTIFTTPTAGISSLDVITLQATGSGTYQWINCSTGQLIAGATNATFTAISNGTYAVIVSNGSCSDTSNCVNISHVGLEENTKSFDVTLVPNPTQKDVTLTFSEASEAHVVIFDSQGKTVFSADHVHSGTVLSTESFENGVYLIQIITSTSKHVQRIIKQ